MQSSRRTMDLPERAYRALLVQSARGLIPLVYEDIKMTTEFEVKGMSCENCVGHVTKALLGNPGVSSALVSLEKGRATVEYDETSVTIQQLAQAIQEEGFDARPVS